MRKLRKPQLVKKLDRIHSKVVRMRACDSNNVVKCVTCGKFMDWKEAHCGHYVGRRHMTTRWDFFNTAVQCPACNTFQEGAKDEYTLYIIREYGVEKLEELNRKKHGIAKWETFELEEMIKEREEEFEELSKGV